MPTCPPVVANGLPCTSWFSGEFKQGGAPVKVLPGGPLELVTVGSSPKIACPGLSGGNFNFGGLGGGGWLLVLPARGSALTGLFGVAEWGRSRRPISSGMDGRFRPEQVAEFTGRRTIAG